MSTDHREASPPTSTSLGAGVPVSQGAGPARALALAAWLIALALLPAIWLGLDQYTDEVRIGLNTVPALLRLMKAVQPCGYFPSQVVILSSAALIGWLLRWRAAWRWLLVTVIAILVTGVITNGLKVAVRRERPAVTSSRIHAETPLAEITTGKKMSFPSGDSSCAFAIACVLAAFAPRLRWFGWILAGLVGVERIYFGTHYLSDVWAGALVGIGGTALVLAWVRKHTRLLPTHAASEMTSP